MARTVLMVAEKPSLAEAIAHHLSNGSAVKKGHGLPVFEYSASFKGQKAYFKVTSTTGHIFGCDFTPQHQSWERTDEDELFDAPTVQKESGGARVVHHLQREAEGCDTLVLWLDCDREGENICFEVMSVVKRHIYRMDNIWRAQFSAITAQEIGHAMANLGKPNKNISDAVECRQELDLKVGVAFTRFQTKYFQNKYGDLDASVVSYGPCQTPTLGFCVQRHDEIMNFKPENFWRIVPTASRGGVTLTFEWDRGRLFDEQMARLMHKKVTESKIALVTGVAESNDTRVRPTALNTVELLKIASSFLGMSPHTTMHVAEHLYISGYISYPRTESSAYPPSFDLRGALEEQCVSQLWGPYVTKLLTEGITRPKAGHDAGDHPPITPMCAASPGELSGDAWRLYEYITRHFIASLSPDCRMRKTKITIDLCGEVFTVSGKVTEVLGWIEVMPRFTVVDDKLPEGVAMGDDLHISDVRLTAGKTQAPGYLTESELIGLMEKHGIGTDASIATHIQNICDRNYCAVQGGRTMVPTKLGTVLVHGIQMIDPELTLPTVRGHVEAYVTQIADGKARLDEVLQYALDLFARKFKFFRSNIDRMDALFAASFSPPTATGKYISRCGICVRYMRHLETRPQRLYCQTCEVTYALPQGGHIKQYSTFTCPLDGFELLISHVDGGKSVAFCPYCYNNPPFEAAVTGTRSAMSCADCRHPTCRHSLMTNYVCDCVDLHCKGAMAFEPGSGGRWRVSCNMCCMYITLPPTALRVRVVNEECLECNARKIDIHFPEKKSPLATREEKLVGCIFCHTALSQQCQEVKGRTGNFGRSRGGGGDGGGRGRGRGRGGRGRGGRGRGGGGRRDVWEA